MNLSNLLVPIPYPPRLNPKASRVRNMLLVVLVAIGGIYLYAEEISDAAELVDSAKEVLVQPNGYFKLSSEHHLNTELVTYGDLIDKIYEIVEEKIVLFWERSGSIKEVALPSDEESMDESKSVQRERTWKRRILVLLDGKRVIGTADRNMKIEDHLGTSLDTVESLEGFLPTKVDPNQIADPRVLNFVSKTPIPQEVNSTPDSSNLKIEES